jgi:hypothetical protein
VVFTIDVMTLILTGDVAPDVERKAARNRHDRLPQGVG